MLLLLIQLLVCKSVCFIFLVISFPTLSPKWMTVFAIEPCDVVANFTLQTVSRGSRLLPTKRSLIWTFHVLYGKQKKPESGGSSSWFIVQLLIEMALCWGDAFDRWTTWSFKSPFQCNRRTRCKSQKHWWIATLMVLLLNHLIVSGPSRSSVAS